ECVRAVGEIGPRKNLPRLVEALRALRSRPRLGEIALVHTGPDGWRPEEVTRAVRDLDLGDVVRFLGYVPLEELRVLYGLARVFVYPSLWEGFGLPVLEAMACGCPVVTAGVSSLPEVAGDAAVLVDPTSVDDIARGIAAVWGDDGMRACLVERGRARARQYSWERAAHRQHLPAHRLREAAQAGRRRCRHPGTLPVVRPHPARPRARVWHDPIRRARRVGARVDAVLLPPRRRIRAERAHRHLSVH